MVSTASPNSASSVGPSLAALLADTSILAHRPPGVAGSSVDLVPLVNTACEGKSLFLETLESVGGDRVGKDSNAKSTTPVVKGLPSFLNSLSLVFIGFLCSDVCGGKYWC